MSDEIKLMIGGDLVPTDSNREIFIERDVGRLIGGKLALVWNAADYRIVNLEAPLLDEGVPIKKSGPCLKAALKTVRGLQALNINVVSMANNHIMDYGEEGLKSTESALDDAGILRIGTGKNKKDANRGLIQEINGFKVGIYACSEHEFSAAGISSPGANAIGVDTSIRISEIKNECDYLIVLFHGGKEHYPFPTPMQQDRCRSFVDAGADFVVCQHSHCVGCEETYKEKKIVYGQGNYIFDYKDDECWKNGLILEVCLKRLDGSIIPEYMYYPICKEEECIRLAEEELAEHIMNAYEKRSSLCSDSNSVYSLFEEIVAKEGELKLRKLFAWPRWLRGFDRFCLNGRLIVGKIRKGAIAAYGVVACETDFEILENYIKTRNK